MDDWLIQFKFEIFIFFSSLAFLSLFLAVFYFKKQFNQLKSMKEALSTSLSNLVLFQTEFENRLEVKLSNNQQQLYEVIFQDKERQLTSINELQIKLERRFSDSGVLLSNDLQAFKLKMIKHFEALKNTIGKTLSEGQHQQTIDLNQFGEKIYSAMTQHQMSTRNVIEEKINSGIKQLRDDLDRSLTNQSNHLRQNILSLTESTDRRLKEISGQVEKKLNEGFNKTNQTFTDIVKRLALIDDAQKKITELSSNVVSLQEVLNDKRSRGAFGEIQLQSLISNTMPEAHYSMQCKLSNEKIVDCLLLLPKPTGKIAIDAKFPLENYQKMTDLDLAASDRLNARKLFSRDIKKHINDISSKYILPPETSDGAVMFIPAESVFAEIHGHFPELVERAYQKKVWMVSPTTLMAILTTASAVIKDEQTRQQIHTIKKHLNLLAQDFNRFQERMNNLSKHVGQVTKDVESVHVSARKISSHFGKIERVELNKNEDPHSLEAKEI